MSQSPKKASNRSNLSKRGGKSIPFNKRISKNPKNKIVKEGMRLNQFIAHAGICSRREADQFIAAGLVSINDEVVTKMGYRVKPSDAVKFNNELIKSEKKSIYYSINLKDTSVLRRS